MGLGDAGADRRDAARRTLLTVGVALAAALACKALRTPLPWMIGPLLATALASAAGLPLAASRRLRDGGQWIIGTALGLHFTPEVARLVLGLAPALAAGVLWSLLLGHGFYRVLWRCERARGLQPATAYFAAAIGGASEMAILAERAGAQVDRVAAAHATRVLIVVVLIPLVFAGLGVHGADLHHPAARSVQPAGLAALLAATACGGALLRWLGLPNPWVLGALAVGMGLSASGQSWSSLPRPLVDAAQLLIAITLGVRFTPATLRAAPRWLGAVAAGTLAMVAASAVFAAALAWAAGLHPATVLLGTSPGGMAEMAISAAVLGLGVPVVTAFHVLRYAAVLVLTQPLWRREARRLARRRGP